MIPKPACLGEHNALAFQEPVVPFSRVRVWHHELHTPSIKHCALWCRRSILHRSKCQS